MHELNEMATVTTCNTIGESLYHESLGEIHTRRVGNTLYVGYLTPDTDPPDYEWGDCQGEFKEFQDPGSMREFIKAQEAAGKVYFLVDRYQHGLVHYSARNTENYPDRQWDVACCAVYVPPEDLQGWEYDRLVKSANAILNEYSDWCNGSVYGVVVETWQKQEEGLWERVEEETCWGHIGLEWAEQELEAQMGSYK